MDKKMLNFIGFILGLFGLGVSFASSKISDKQTELMVDEKIKEALENQSDEAEEE